MVGIQKGLVITFSLLVLSLLHISAVKREQAYSLQFARVKYNGGGDWYSSRTALKNLAEFCNRQLGTSIDPIEAQVDVGSSDIFNYPFLFLTGHGNIVFSEQEAANLREYLLGGGFLHICDNYGLDAYIRKEMKKVFPDQEFTELPFTHDIYHQVYSFPSGLPKIHEHDGKSPKGYAILHKGRVICFYDYECDLGNGWENPEVYNDDPELRKKALQMGANLVHYAFSN